MCVNYYLKFVGVFVCGLMLTGASGLEIQPCKEDDAQCAKESGNAIASTFALGIPELGIEKSDPMHIEKIDLSTGNLRLILQDITIVGLKDCRVKKIERNHAAEKLFAKVQCNAKVDGKYEMSGQMLVLPVQGKGDVHLVLRKIQLNVDVDLQEIEREGKKYWNVKKFKHSYDVKEKSDIVFENMFNGNEILGQAAKELFTVSWKEIVYELGPPLVKAVTEKVVKNVNSLFHAIPVEKLELS